MKNRKGETVHDRIERSIEHIRNLDDKELKRSFAIKLLGTVDFAVEFDLITYNEWASYIESIFDAA